MRAEWTLLDAQKHTIAEGDSEVRKTNKGYVVKFGRELVIDSTDELVVNLRLFRHGEQEAEQTGHGSDSNDVG